MSDYITLKGTPYAPVKVAELQTVLNTLAGGMMAEVQETIEALMKWTTKELASRDAEIARLRRDLDTERRLRLGGQRPDRRWV